MNNDPCAIVEIIFNSSDPNNKLSIPTPASLAPILSIVFGVHFFLSTIYI